MADRPRAEPYYPEFFDDWLLSCLDVRRRIPEGRATFDALIPDRYKTAQTPPVPATPTDEPARIICNATSKIP